MDGNAPRVRRAFGAVLIAASTIAFPASADAPAESAAPAVASAPPASSAVVVAPSAPSASSASASASARPARPGPTIVDKSGDAVTPCPPTVTAWASRVSDRTKHALVAVTCPTGRLRLRQTFDAASYDYEVTRGDGFRTTKNGFGVSPIVDLVWETAPRTLHDGLAEVLAQLELDAPFELSKDRAPKTSELARYGPFPREWRTAAIIAGVAALAIAYVVLGRRRKAATPPPAA